MAWERKQIQKKTPTCASLQPHFCNCVAKHPLKVKYYISTGNGESKSITKTTITFFDIATCFFKVPPICIQNNCRQQFTFQMMEK